MAESMRWGGREDGLVALGKYFRVEVSNGRAVIEVAVFPYLDPRPYFSDIIALCVTQQTALWELRKLTSTRASVPMIVQASKSSSR